MSSKSRGPLFVISGPSGSGKTTLVAEVLKRCRFPLRRIITATTREPRPGEQQGRDYHFWSLQRFEEAIQNREFIEYAQVFGKHYYGTPRSEVEPYRDAGTGVIAVIDVQGAQAIREVYPTDHTSIFLGIPSLEVLAERLKQRGTESPESLARRLRTAESELAEQPKFQHTIVNDDLERAITELTELIEAHYAPPHQEQPHAG